MCLEILWILKILSSELVNLILFHQNSYEVIVYFPKCLKIPPKEEPFRFTYFAFVYLALIPLLEVHYGVGFIFFSFNGLKGTTLSNVSRF